MPALRIRPATDADRAAIALVQTESWRSAYAGVLGRDYLANNLTPDLARHWDQQRIRPQDVVLVAERDGEPVGFIAVWVDDTAFIDNLHVRPAVRSGGIGRALMQAAARILARGGHDRAFLWVVQANSRAIRFYERLGGTVTETGVKDLFGTPTPVVRIDWTGLSPLTDPKA